MYIPVYITLMNILVFLIYLAKLVAVYNVCINISKYVYVTNIIYQHMISFMNPKRSFCIYRHQRYEQFKGIIRFSTRKMEIQRSTLIESNAMKIM